MACNHENTDSQRAQSRQAEPHQTNVLLALMAGVGAGLAAGILLAPKAGDKLRNEIGKAVNGYLDAACASAGSVSGKVAAAVDRGENEIDNAIGIAKDHSVSAIRAGARIGREAVHSVAETFRPDARA